MTDSEINDMKKRLKKGKLLEVAEQYIESCAEEDKFPNMAGFCRYCHIGQGELDEIGKKFSREFDALCSVFEDEALNSDVAVTLIGSYMKRYLGYGEEKKSNDAPVSVYFEHDILKDGK
ncbi:MAG: hypothetical protein IKJ91_11915 [Clostridia bacterium]|nr:hypothetical protein [Clostridia bacterium]